MVLLAVLSGLINLSAQTVFLKVVSMTAGDLYTTYIIVALTFILGSGVGGFFSNLIRPWLHWVEALTGCYTLFLGILLSGSFYHYDVPLWFVSAGLILPALALGTHLPLYGYYLRRIRFGLLYFLYHFGAVLGLMMFEWYFIKAGSVKDALLFTGAIQLTLGMLLLRQKHLGNLKLEQSGKFLSPLQWIKLFPKSAFSVFFASTLSYYEVFWALRTQLLITDAFRMHATLISCAVFFWMALAGILSKRLQTSSEKVFLGMGLSFAIVYLTFPFLSLNFTGLFNGSIWNYFQISFGLALFLTLPVFCSSLVFIVETRSIQSRLPIDVVSGGLNLFSCLGNVTGFFIAGTLAAYFWQPLYFLFAVASCIGIFLFWHRPKGYRLILYSVASATILFAMSYIDLTKTLFLNHLSIEARATERIENIFLSSDAFSTMATFDLKTDDEKDNVQKLYIVDGHLSHNLDSSAEFIVGLTPAMYFNGPPKKTMVIGLGSGQTSWAAAAISEHTELVEISQSVVKNVRLLRDYNFDLMEKKNVNVLLQDALSIVRNCQPESYDLIINTSTYPSNHGASKLYSDEMSELSENCLDRNGIYVTYFDGSTVNDLTDFYEFVYPIMRHFRHLDISIKPYPIVIAYNTPRKLEALSAKDFIDPADFEIFDKRFPNTFATKCRTFLRNVPLPGYEPLLSSMDRSYLERNSLRLSIQSKNINHVSRTFPELYNTLSNTPLYSCE